MFSSAVTRDFMEWCFGTTTRPAFFFESAIRLRKAKLENPLRITSFLSQQTWKPAWNDWNLSEILLHGKKLIVNALTTNAR